MASVGHPRWCETHLFICTEQGLLFSIARGVKDDCLTRFLQVTAAGCQECVMSKSEWRLGTWRSRRLLEDKFWVILTVCSSSSLVLRLSNQSSRFSAAMVTVFNLLVLMRPEVNPAKRPNENLCLRLVSWPWQGVVEFFYSTTPYSDWRRACLPETVSTKQNFVSPLLLCCSEVKFRPSADIPLPPMKFSSPFL